MSGFELTKKNYNIFFYIYDPNNKKVTKLIKYMNNIHTIVYRRREVIKKSRGSINHYKIHIPTKSFKN